MSVLMTAGWIKLDVMQTVGSHRIKKDSPVEWKLSLTMWVMTLNADASVKCDYEAYCFYTQVMFSFLFREDQLCLCFGFNFIGVSLAVQSNLSSEVTISHVTMMIQGSCLSCNCRFLAGYSFFSWSATHWSSDVMESNVKRTALCCRFTNWDWSSVYMRTSVHIPVPGTLVVMGTWSLMLRPLLTGE